MFEMFERNWYFQWEKQASSKCTIALDNPALQWKESKALGKIKFSRGSGGLLAYLSDDNYILIQEGKVYYSSYIISVKNWDGNTYIHVAWSEKTRQEECTTSANHWFAIWLRPFSTLKRKHIARMNYFVRRCVGRSEAITWVEKY